jgi:negative regulator of sigma E activity
MTCGEARERLDDYLDGSLPESQFHEVELHLAGCETCRQEESRLRRLLDLAATLPREMKPRRDLWPELAARIEAERSGAGSLARSRPRLRASPAALAAAAAVLIAVASVVTHVGGARVGGPRESLPTLARPAAVSGPAHVQDAETEYVRATGQLMAALNARRGSLSPETMKAVDDNLRTIDDALRQVREALDKEPGNRQLTQMLASTHQKKLDLLLRLLRLSARI